jgi:hypothetical protein
MRAYVCAAALVAAASLTGAETRDPKAVQIAESMMKAMGGSDAWMRAPFIRYDFIVTAGGKEVVNRAHLWNKMTGRYRLEDRTKAGKPRVTLFNVNTREGTAYVDGKKLEGAAAAAALKEAYATWINDMYWLSMPWKWMDPGVNLKYQGEKPLAGKKYEVVELTFGKVGLTPGDRYHAFVSPESGLMEHWDFTLQDGHKGSFDWEYTTTGGVKLASNHKSPDGTTINMGNVQITQSADDKLFTDPAKGLR